MALTRRPRLARPVLGFANVVQTIPSLALFGFLIPLPVLGGIGARTAIVALVVYSLLPILRNTHAGILSVDPAVVEAAIGLGMTPAQRMRLVELPLALPVVLAGVRVAVVVGIGLATIAAAIGAGGLGVLIYRGVATVDHRLILAGAVPAALLALAFDFGLGAVEKRLGPRAVNRLAPLLLAAVFLAAAGCGRPGERPLRVGSKNFTEQVILGEIAAQALERAGVAVERKLDLGGTFVCHRALVAGELDLYPEYTGTAFTAILQEKPISDPVRVRETVAREYRRRWTLEWAPPLGFENTFALVMRADQARELKSHEDLRPRALRGPAPARIRLRVPRARGRIPRPGRGLRPAFRGPSGGDGSGAALSCPRAGQGRRRRGQLHRRPDRRDGSRGAGRRPSLFPALRSRLRLPIDRVER